MSFLIEHQEFLIGCFISALGIVVSIYLYVIAQKYRQIAYTLQSTNISLKNILDENESFSVTDIIIWCKGRVLIDNNDVAPSCPLKISTSGENKILNCQIIAVNEPANNFQLSATDKDITVEFDYLNYKNGIALRVIHTGDGQNISVGCKLKDGKKLLFVCHRKGFLYKFLNNKHVKYILSSKAMSLIFIIFTIFLFPTAFVQSANYAPNNFFNLPDSNVFMNLDSAIILVLCVVSAILAIPHVYNLFKSEPPKDLLKNTLCEK